MSGVIVYATMVGGVELCSQMKLMSFQPRAEMKKRMIMIIMIMNTSMI